MSHTARENLVELDCLRGIAILLVFFHHADGMMTANLASGGVEMNALRSLIGGGQTGVSLFFVVSAFCLSLPIFRPGGVERFRAAEFFRRRALRILPLYWTVVVFAALLVGTGLPSAFPYMVFGQAIPDLLPVLPGFSPVWWSLATEAQFYLLLPLLPLCLASRPGRCIALAGVAAYVAVYGLYAAAMLPVRSVLGELAISYSIFGRGPLLLFGIGAAWVYANYGRTISLWTRSNGALRYGASDALLCACVFALGSMLSWVVFTGYFTATIPPGAVWHVGEGLAWSTIVLLFLSFPVRSKALFVNRPMAAIGRWSYSIYLLHLAVLSWVVLPLRDSSPRFRSWDLETGAVVMGALMLSVALSAMTYQLIEKPFLRRKNRAAATASTQVLSEEPA